MEKKIIGVFGTTHLATVIASSFLKKNFKVILFELDIKKLNDIKNQNKNYVLQYNNILYPNAVLIKTSGSFSYDNFIFFKKQSGMYPDVYDVYDYISKKNFEITVNNQDPDFLKPL